MKKIAAGAALALLVLMGGCGGKSAGAGGDFIFYSYEEVGEDKKKHTVQEAVPIKMITECYLYEAGHYEKEPLLWLKAAGRDHKIWGSDGVAIFKALKSKG